MGLLKISASLLCQDKDILPTCREYFDQFVPLDEISGEDPIYRVSKDSLGIVFNDDATVTICMKRIPTSVINSGTTIMPLKITEVNGIAIELQNFGPKNPPQESIFHIKSKG